MIFLWNIICSMIELYRRSWPVPFSISLALFIAGFNVKPAILLFTLAGIAFFIAIAMVISDVKDCRNRDQKEKYDSEHPHLV